MSRQIKDKTTTFWILEMLDYITRYNELPNGSGSTRPGTNSAGSTRPVFGPDSAMVRASASEAGGRGFDPGPRHTKDVKNGTSGYLA